MTAPANYPCAPPLLLTSHSMLHVRTTLVNHSPVLVGGGDYASESTRRS